MMLLSPTELKQRHFEEDESSSCSSTSFYDDDVDAGMHYYDCHDVEGCKSNRSSTRSLSFWRRRQQQQQQDEETEKEESESSFLSPTTPSYNPTLTNRNNNTNSNNKEEQVEDDTCHSLSLTPTATGSTTKRFHTLSLCFTWPYMIGIDLGFMYQFLILALDDGDEKEEGLPHGKNSNDDDDNIEDHNARIFYTMIVGMTITTLIIRIIMYWSIHKWLQSYSYADAAGDNSNDSVCSKIRKIFLVVLKICFGSILGCAIATWLVPSFLGIFGTKCAFDGFVLGYGFLSLYDEFMFSTKDK